MIWTKSKDRGQNKKGQRALKRTKRRKRLMSNEKTLNWRSQTTLNREAKSIFVLNSQNTEARDRNTYVKLWWRSIWPNRFNETLIISKIGTARSVTNTHRRHARQLLKRKHASSDKWRYAHNIRDRNRSRRWCVWHGRISEATSNGRWAATRSGWLTNHGPR